MDPTARAPLHGGIKSPSPEIPGLSKQSGMEAADEWHLKVREGGRETKLAVEKSCLWLRGVDGRREPGGSVCKKEKEFM